MTERPGSGSIHQRVWLVGLVLGWLALAASYYLGLPFFGVLSTVTWALIMVCWLWVIGLPVVMAGRLAWRRALRQTLACGVASVLAGALLWTLGLPQRTPQGQFAEHRDDLAWLAAEYRDGGMSEDAALPLRLRFLSVDGQAHIRCGLEHADCALFLLTWQDWRGESGTGLAYYRTPPGPDALLVTAEGDAGKPIRELDAGWWVVG